jgi:uncharacterized membrane protein
MSSLNVLPGLFAQMADSPAISINGLINTLVPVVGLVGGCLILWGAYGAVARQVSAETALLRGQPLADDRSAARPPFAYYLALGLEFMIAASAIKTLVTPDLQQVGVLVGMVLSRAVVGLYPRWEKSKWLGLPDDRPKPTANSPMPEVAATVSHATPQLVATADMAGAGIRETVATAERAH